MSLRLSLLLSCVAGLLSFDSSRLIGFTAGIQARSPATSSGVSNLLACRPQEPCAPGATEQEKEASAADVASAAASMAFAAAAISSVWRRSSRTARAARGPTLRSTARPTLPLCGGVTEPIHGPRHLVARQSGPALMPWKIPNTTQWQWLSVKELLLRERILMVTEYLDDNMANAYLAMLLYLQSEDAQKPVQIYFSSPGAALKPALALYDTICQLKSKGCQVTTVTYSLCAGMGAFLCASGSPGRRFATPNSMFLLSKTGLESPFEGQASDIEVEARQMLRECNRIEEELSAITGKPVEKISQDLERNFYLSAAEAVEYGLIDKVLVPEKDKGSKLDKGTRDPWSGQVVKTETGFGVFSDPDQPRTAV
ncbi:unnamed protein product [Polarella glacialis]|nr:unnamed protein product [Polarella glacialis]